MKKLLSIFVFTLISTLSAEAKFGAIAYSPSTSAGAYAWDCDSLSECETGVLRYCNRPDCLVTVSVEHGCAVHVIAKNEFTRYATAISSDLESAEATALSACGSDCYTKMYVCVE